MKGDALVVGTALHYAEVSPQTVMRAAQLPSSSSSRSHVKLPAADGMAHANAGE